MTANDLDLLGQFTREQSQDAFTELVKRHVNLVYSAALRQVRAPHLAEEVSQSVFTNLANHAAKLAPDTILTAWLYRVTCNAAIDLVRSEARRQAREQIALQLSDMNDDSEDWKRIEPLLDEAMSALDETDRTAILLRYFENKSLREVGERLGTSDDAAQKRVTRAIDRLREHLTRRQVKVGASGLAALVSANAIQAAPAGLASTFAAGAVLASAAAVTTTTLLTTSPTIALAMTATQKALITAVILGAIATGVYQARQASDLREQVKVLKQQQSENAELTSKLKEMEAERDAARKQLAATSNAGTTPGKNPNEVLKLRGEVGRLRQEKAEISSSSSLSKVTANPEAKKMLREQQKMGMTMIYKGFADRSKLTTEQAEKLNDLLADHIMENVGHVTTILRDKSTTEQMDQIFKTEEKNLQDKVQELLGAEGQSQYADYTKNLLSLVTAEQFKSMMTGNDADKVEKAKQLSQLLQEESKAALAKAGLPEDYQLVPMLNFRNIASEQEGDKSLKLLEEIYQNAAARSGAFLTPEDLTKFKEFQNLAINNNRGALSLNRTMMEPISK